MAIVSQNFYITVSDVNFEVHEIVLDDEEAESLLAQLENHLRV